MKTIFLNVNAFIKNKAITFLKQSFLIPFIFATLLYILMRIFFIGSEFDISESVELYVKTFLVTWAYINAWRLICLGIIWIEAKTTRASIAKIITMPVLKKTAILILIAGITYTVKARSLHKPGNGNVKTIIERNEALNEIDPKFYCWMK
ncbi:MAG: hypothetical protein ABI741_12740 [Ferruginibacter sp.]